MFKSTLLQQPDATTIKGRRDLALLSLMYDTGARKQEIIDLTPSMLRLNKPSTIKIIGKGNKARLVPMLDVQIGHLENYLKENKLTESHANMHPLFFNSRKKNSPGQVLIISFGNIAQPPEKKIK